MNFVESPALQGGEDVKERQIIDYGEYIPSSMNIRMKSKGVWTNIYTPYPPEKKRSIPPREGAERLYAETGELVECEQCGCVDFVKKGEEYVCAICCQSNTS